MKNTRLLVILCIGICLSLIQACGSVDPKGVEAENFRYSIVTKSDSFSVLNLEIRQKGEWKKLKPRFLHWKVYRLEQGDVNQDGKPEALVGVIKSTPFDSIHRKRLFIFTQADGFIAPLWMGSRVHNPLVDFRLIKNGKAKVMTIEVQQNGLYSTNEYEYGSFGLSFLQTLESDLDSITATQSLFYESR